MYIVHTVPECRYKYLVLCMRRTDVWFLIILARLHESSATGLAGTSTVHGILKKYTTIVDIKNSHPECYRVGCSTNRTQAACTALGATR